MLLEVSLGNVKAKIPYNTEEELIVVKNVAKELNISCNRILSHLDGNVDDIVLLSFLLFETGLKLYSSLQRPEGERMMFFLKSINKYIQIKTKNDMDSSEKMEEIEKLKETLVVVNIVKKIELNSKNVTNGDGNNEFNELINSFGDDIKNYIKNMEKMILLS